MDSKTLCKCYNSNTPFRKYGNKKENQKLGRPYKTIIAMLREDFAELEDSQCSKALDQVDLEDKLIIGSPAIKKEKKRKGKTTEDNLFFYIHLSPFARLSISEVYSLSIGSEK